MQKEQVSSIIPTIRRISDVSVHEIPISVIIEGRIEIGISKVDASLPRGQKRKRGVALIKRNPH